MIEIQLHILDGHIKTDRVLYLQETLITLAKNYSNKSLNLIMRVFSFFFIFRSPYDCCPNTKWDPTEDNCQGKRQPYLSEIFKCSQL